MGPRGRTRRRTPTLRERPRRSTLATMSDEPRTVVITGGLGALGQAVTLHFARAGDQVVLPVQSQSPDLPPALAPCAAGCRLRLGHDLTDAKSVARLFDELPRVDVLVHLVGGFAMGAIQDTELDTWRRMIDLNATSAFLCVRAALGAMRRTGHGRIVTVASRAAEAPTAGQAAYAAAKAAVLALTRAVADETRGSDITANCVLPGIIDTPANRAAMGETTVATWVAPADLAESIFFLASPAAGALRGTALRAYGST